MLPLLLSCVLKNMCNIKTVQPPTENWPNINECTISYLYQVIRCQFSKMKKCLYKNVRNHNHGLVLIYNDDENLFNNLYRCGNKYA
jgi:hypothetical protein